MLTLLLLSVPLGCAPQDSAPKAPDDRGSEDARWATLETILDRAVEAGSVPGAACLVSQDGESKFEYATGKASIEGQAMTIDTVFDLASLTKVVATATSVMILVDRGEIELGAPVAKYLPEFGANGKQDITVEHLLLHQGALIPDNALADYEDGPKVAWEKICALKPRAEPGTTFTYTDVGFITLGKLVETISGRTLDRFSREEIFEPLGMSDTTFVPGPELRERAAPTEKRDGAWMKGEVHDPRAYLLNGVAGHAGLFSTARDLGVWCEMILGLGAVNVGGEDVRILSERALAEMTRPRWLANSTGGRALGFDVDTGYSSPRGSFFPRGTSFGHTGFTGTCFWLDPEHQVFYVLLTNRVHPDGKGSVTPLRRAASNEIARVLGVDELPMVNAVSTGADVLQASGCAALDGMRVGVITNTTGRTLDGERTIDVIHGAANVELVRVFSPEHGLFAKLEGSVGDATDETTGLPVFSLYGDTRKPTKEMLEGLDAVVFDIQDVGVRYYTYISTLGLAMEACAEHGVRVVVLDRPNPITGERVAGPRCDEDRLSFIAWRPMPVTHGMTVGEIAKMFNAEWGGIGCELEVVAMTGWKRAMWFEDTGQLWVNPSPNMRNPTQAVLYPCVGLLEGMNLSVGRGTDEPFERFGAPWIDGPRLAAALQGAGIAGLDFTAIEFTPDASKFEGELCQGVHVTVRDREELRPVEAGLAVVWVLNRLDGKNVELGKADSRLMSRETWKALVTAQDWRGVAATWADDERSFRARREPYLMYE